MTTSSSAVLTDGFLDLGVPSNLVDALAPQGITSPTPIQAATLADSLAGRDVLGRGRTGSGKTYAFLLPTVARLTQDQSRRRPQPGRPQALILAPTRELALQIEDSMAPLAQATGLSTLTIFGGVGQNPQVKATQRGVDVLVACPGRLLDLMGQGHIDLSSVDHLVIDEADHMADMGFLPMVRRIMDKVPASAQKMLFSATLDEGVGVLVKKYLRNPVVHEADSAVSPVSTMDHHVLSVDGDAKMTTLVDLCAAPGRTIVFTRTKYGAKKAARKLRQSGVAAVELHGNLSQNARTRNLDAFHSGTVETLVATDIAARGIHVDNISLVVHADPPAEHKAYLHRSGRTARAGQAGTVITLAGSDQRDEVRQLMRAAKIKPTVHTDGTDRQVLDRLAPGKRSFQNPADVEKTVAGLGSATSGSGASGQSVRGSRARQGGSEPTGSTGGRSRGGHGRGRGGQGQSRSSQGGVSPESRAGRGGQRSERAPRTKRAGEPRRDGHTQRSSAATSAPGQSRSDRPGNRRAGSPAGAPAYTSETGRGSTDHRGERGGRDGGKRGSASGTGGRARTGRSRRRAPQR